MKPLKILIVGVEHPNKDSCKKIEEVGDRERPDAIFIEANTKKLKDMRRKQKCYLVLRNPLFFFFYLLYQFPYQFKFLNREDLICAEKVATNLNIQIYRIDDELAKIFAYNYIVSAIISWVFIISSPLIIFFFLHIPWLTIIITIIFWVVSAVFYSGLYMCATIPKRNDYMKKKLEEIAKKHNYQNVMLITGKNHVEHFKKIFPSSEYNIETYLQDDACLKL